MVGLTGFDLGISNKGLGFIKGLGGLVKYWARVDWASRFRCSLGFIKD